MRELRFGSRETNLDYGTFAIVTSGQDEGRRKPIRQGFGVCGAVELWSKNRRGHVTIYDRGKAALMSAEMDGSEENGLTIARKVEIEAAVRRLKQLTIEFETEAQAFDAS
jgi:hypothetical protein